MEIVTSGYSRRSIKITIALLCSISLLVPLYPATAEIVGGQISSSDGMRRELAAPFATGPRIAAGLVPVDGGRTVFEHIDSANAGRGESFDSFLGLGLGSAGASRFITLGAIAPDADGGALPAGSSPPIVGDVAGEHAAARQAGADRTDGAAMRTNRIAPEPGVLLLIGLGVVILAFSLRRRKRRRRR